MKLRNAEITVDRKLQKSRSIPLTLSPLFPIPFFLPLLFSSLSRLLPDPIGPDWCGGAAANCRRRGAAAGRLVRGRVARHHGKGAAGGGGVAGPRQRRPGAVARVARGRGGPARWLAGQLAGGGGAAELPRFEFFFANFFFAKFFHCKFFSL